MSPDMYFFHSRVFLLSAKWMQGLMGGKKAFVFTCDTSGADGMLLFAQCQVVYHLPDQSRHRVMPVLRPGKSFCFQLAPFTHTLWLKEVCGGKVICLVCFSSLVLTCRLFFFSLKVVYFLMDVWHVVFQIWNVWGAEHAIIYICLNDFKWQHTWHLG